MIKITANNLTEALLEASKQLNCSINELEYEVIQNEKSGFLGLGKKEAIIVASKKVNNASSEKMQENIKPESNPDSTIKQNIQNDKTDNEDFFDASAFLPEAESKKEFQTKDEVISEITKEIKQLFSYMPYKIDKFKVSFYDAQTLYIYIDGEDSALLIGERGYRYKAISYLLFNWIQPTYGYNIRLEVAEFLKNQEEAMDIYLTGIINEVKREGKAQTKPLDGILAFIALKKLRDQFPDKYISFRFTPQEERYIIINDFYR